MQDPKEIDLENQWFDEYGQRPYDETKSKCKHGYIIEEEICNIPGFREHDRWTDCPICQKKLGARPLTVNKSVKIYRLKNYCATYTKNGYQLKGDNAYLFVGFNEHMDCISAVTAVYAPEPTEEEIEECKAKGTELGTWSVHYMDSLLDKCFFICCTDDVKKCAFTLDVAEEIDKISFCRIKADIVCEGEFENADFSHLFESMYVTEETVNNLRRGMLEKYTFKVKE